MPRTGRPATPIEQKRRRGTLRADRTPTTLAVIEAVPPSALGTSATVQGLVESGAAVWIGQTDLPIVEVAVRLEGDMGRLRAALDDEFTPAGWKAYIEAVKEYRACLSLLGLTPSDRARLGVAEVKARSKLEELMDRRRTRTANSA